jgi:hypothetical protein
MVAVVVAMGEGGGKGTADITVAGFMDDLLGGTLEFEEEVLALALHESGEVAVPGLVLEERKCLDRALQEADGEVALRVMSEE